MWVEAVLSQEDLRKVVDDFSPLTIRVGDEEVLSLFEPTDVSIVAGTGVRIACQARLRWPLLGVSVPVAIKSLVVIVRPLIVKGDDERLVFKLALESADLAMVPAAIGERLTEGVNKKLAADHVALSWNFTKTLSHTFPLPPAVETAASLGLRVAWGEVRITHEALVFAVSFQTQIGKR